MGNLIHDRKQKPLPWESRKTTCRRCKGGKTVYYAAIRGGVEVVGGRRVPCPIAAARARSGLRPWR